MGCYPHFILPMRSSRGFASAAANWDAPFGLAFASAPVQSTLTWLTTASRRIIMQKARRHPQGCPRWAPTACRRVVSGSLSSPDRGSSHLSLALLGPLSVAREYLALGDGPPRFEPTFTCSVLLRCRLICPPLPRTGLSPAVAEHSRTLPLGYWQTKCRTYNPTRTSPGGLGSSAFARRY
jgi:hypothetical protein